MAALLGSWGCETVWGESAREVFAARGGGRTPDPLPIDRHLGNGERLFRHAPAPAWLTCRCLDHRHPRSPPTIAAASCRRLPKPEAGATRARSPTRRR
jgi:hypothetical protein